MNEELLKLCTVDRILAVMKKKDYTVFDGMNGSRDYDLNTILIRSNNQIAGDFDDIECPMWYHNGVWTIKHYSITTDPGVPYLVSPLSELGCAILKPGQYRGMWAVGYHRGKLNHKALVQVDKCTVIRDNNLDNILDFTMPTNAMTTKTENKGYKVVTKWYNPFGELVWVEETGLFGINNHRSDWDDDEDDKIGKWSAGCQVHNMIGKYNLEFIPLYIEASKVWGNSFTATIITENDLLNV